MQALWRIGDLVVDGRRFEMRRRGEPVQTEPLAFELIRYLIEHRERVVARDELNAALWQGRVVSAGSLGRVVSIARTALDDDAANPQLIETVRGRGYRFVGEVDDLDTSEPPSAVSSVVASAPVGRELELQRAGELLAQGLESGRRVLLFSGEAGIGKTTLGEAVVREGERMGYRARVGRCADDEGVPPYWPWTQILRAERDARGAEDFDALVGDLAHPLSAVLPIMARGGVAELQQLADEARAATDPRSAPEHFGVFDAMTDVIRRLLREAPVLIFLDDLHFADLASLQLLRFLVRAIREPGLVVVGGYRDSVMRERSARGPLLADVTRAGSARTEPLAALSDEQIAELVHVRTGMVPSAELTRELMEQTGGNPFLASQLMPLLQQSDDPLAALAPDGGVAKELPAGVRAGLMQQLHSLPEGCEEILGIAAVIGSEVELDLLCAVVEHERYVVVDCLWAAEQAGLLRRLDGSGDALRFAHLLIRDALREEMPPAQRGEVHHRTALALESRQLTHGEARLARLAHHYGESVELSGIDSALRYERLAGDAAADRWAWEDAAEHYRRALELMDRSHSPSPVARFELLLSLGQAEVAGGQRSAARVSLFQAAELAGRMADGERLCRAALALTPGFFSISHGAVDTEHAALLERALAMLPGGSDLLRVRTIARLAQVIDWSDMQVRREELAELAESIARGSDDARCRVYALTARHSALRGPDQLAERLALTADGILRAEAIGNGELALMHRVFRITALVESGEVDQLEREMATFARIAQGITRPEALWYSLSYSCMRAIAVGEFARGEQLARQFLALAKQYQDDNVIHSYAISMGIAYYQLGRAREVLPMLETMAARYDDVPSWRIALGLFYAELERRDEARAVLEAAAAEGFESIPNDMLWLTSMMVLADVCWLLEDAERAALLYELVEPHADRHIVVGYAAGYLSSVQAVLGRLAAARGDVDLAERHLRTAIREERRVGAIPWATRSASVLLRSLKRAGRPIPQDLLGTALDAAYKFDMLSVAAQLEAVR